MVAQKWKDRHDSAQKLSMNIYNKQVLVLWHVVKRKQYEQQPAPTRSQWRSAGSSDAESPDNSWKADLGEW